jgi:hypothetical protein
LKFNITGLNIILFFIGSHGRTEFWYEARLFLSNLFNL